MDDEDFLAAVEADNADVRVDDKPEAKVETPEAPAETAQEPEQPAPAAAAPVEPPVPTEPPVAAPVAAEPQHAPLTALLDERERRQAAEAKLRQIEQAQLAAQPQQIPDMFENPDEYNAYIGAQLEATRYQDRLFMSERLAKVEHGAEAFTKAKEWGLAKCDSDPFFNAKVRQSQDPYGTVMEEWKREQAASIPTGEFEQFQAWKQAQAALQTQQAPPGAPSNASPNIPPRSLASAPAAGSMLNQPAQSDEEIFEEMFSKKE